MDSGGCVLLDDRSVKDQRIREGDQLVDSFVGTRQTCSVEKYRCHFSAYGVNLGLCCQLSSKQWFGHRVREQGRSAPSCRRGGPKVSRQVR